MRVFITTGYFSLCLVGLGMAEDGLKGDSKAIQGEWQVVEHLPEAEPKVTYYLVEFKGDKMTLHMSRGEKKGSSPCEFKLNAAVNPKQIDIIPLEGANRDKA